MCLGEYGLPVAVLGAAVEVVDRVSLGHLRIGSNLPKVRFLNKNKVNRRAHRGGYGENGMNGNIIFMGILRKNHKIRRNRNGG